MRITTYLPRRLALLALTGLILTSSVSAQDAPQCLSEKALLLARSNPRTPWRVVKAQEALKPGELLVGGPGVQITSKKGTVQLSFLGELAGTSNFPVHETAIILQDSTEYDLEFTLDRGRVDLINLKNEGPARIRIHCQDRSGEIVLMEPKARLALEIFGRWLPNQPFRKDPKPGDRPATAFVLVALQGETEIRGKDREFLLKSPSMLLADQLDEPDPTPHPLEKLPAWAEGTKTKQSEERDALLAKFRAVAMEKSVADAITALATSSNLKEQLAAVYLMGATDDLARLGEVLAASEKREVLDAGVQALRHWIGRGPEQDQKLYQALITRTKMTEKQAETVLHLLHGLSDEELALPLTYQVLMRLMMSDRLALRGLAYWHLSRLVPDGKEFGYNPTASPEKRAEALRRWQALIPPGKMPPRPNVPSK